MMHVDIDPNSGFCFGVVRAVEMAEDYIKKDSLLNSLGQMVHNKEEVSRLEKMGINTVTLDDLDKLSGKSVIIRAHGEPPSTYYKLQKGGFNVIDATCPIVMKLQKRVKDAYEQNPDSQIVIYGKPGHAEVIGLVGQTNGRAFVIKSTDEVKCLDKQKPVIMFSQTTMSLAGYEEMKRALEKYIDTDVKAFDTICRKVSHRVPEIALFAKQYDVIVFVSGKNSSNGNMLYRVALKANLNTYFISSAEELDAKWFDDGMHVGVCGATSTPRWQMEQVKEAIEQIQL